MPGNLIAISKTFSLDIYQIQAELIFTNYFLSTSAIMLVFLLTIPEFFIHIHTPSLKASQPQDVQRTLGNCLGQNQILVVVYFVNAPAAQL